jgi:hypothetical protein
MTVTARLGINVCKLVRFRFVTEMICFNNLKTRKYSTVLSCLKFVGF